MDQIKPSKVDGMDEPKTIACIHLNQIGDLLFSLPALHSLKGRFPEARILSVARPVCAELLKRTSLVDAVIVRPKGGLRASLTVGKEIRSHGPDLLVLFSTSWSTWVIAQASGAATRAGFRESMRGFMLDITAGWTPPPCTANNLHLAEAVGCTVEKTDYVGLVAPSEQDRRDADAVLEGVGIGPDEEFVVLSPGTSQGREIKCWHDEGFARVVDYINQAYGMKAVVAGLYGGEGICSLTEHALDLTGKTSIGVVTGLLARARLLVGVDSGLLHLAAALGTKVVGLYGPTDPSITGPQGCGHTVIRASLPCVPCMKTTCDKDAECMRSIDLVQVCELLAHV